MLSMEEFSGSIILYVILLIHNMYLLANTNGVYAIPNHAYTHAGELFIIS